MTRNTLFTALFLAGAASTAAAQQAPIPPPPKTVNPVPVSTTNCRGCSDVSDDKQSSVGKYDEKKPGTIRSTVRPDAKATTPKTKPKTKPKRKVHRKRTSAAPSTASKVSSKTEVKAKPKPVYIDRPAIGDPLMLPGKDSTKK